MTNQLSIVDTITSLFPLDNQIKCIKSHTDRPGGNVLPVMNDEGKLYHQRLKRPIVALTLNFVSDKDLSLDWEKRVISYSSVIKDFKEDNINFFMIPGLSSLAMSLFDAADIKDNPNINILLPKENTGFVSYNQEQNALCFVVEYSFS